MSAAQQRDILTAVVRPAGKNDWPFILDSWKRSLARAQRRSPKNTWYTRVTETIERLRDRGAVFLMAVDPDFRNQIIGWGCAEPPVLHYLFVKELFREQGIARQLVAELQLAVHRELLCSHWTPYASQISDAHPGILRRILPC